jgi:hypothetical protein
MAETKTETWMRGAAAMLDDFFNPGLRGEDRKIGFVLLAFPFGDTERGVNYIGNGKREEVLAALKELVTLFEQQEKEKLQ